MNKVNIDWRATQSVSIEEDQESEDNQHVDEEHTIIDSSLGHPYQQEESIFDSQNIHPTWEDKETEEPVE